MPMIVFTQLGFNQNGNDIIHKIFRDITDAVLDPNYETQILSEKSAKDFYVVESILNMF